jgi:L-2-hydroxyglutarate oxidase LhgO
VVVIGGGVMGMGTAFLLSERGYKVTVLEEKPDVAQVS